MLTTIPRYRLDLSGAPEIRLLAHAMHGRNPVEHYDVKSWALHFYHYHGELELDGQSVAIAPRHIGLTAPDVKMTYRYSNPESRHLVVLFHLPASRSGGVTVPAMQPGGARFDAIHDALSEVVHLAAAQPARAAIRVWDVLYQVTDLAAQGDDTAELVRAAAGYIDRHLQEPLRVGELAQRFRVSRNHLTRRFRDELGCTVIHYIHRRRLERALDLLRHSDLSVTDIAGSLGFPDLQRFNKFIRSQTDRAPTAHRATS